MGNPVVHWELMSKDPAGIASFYEKLFDWKIQHVPELNYRMVETGGEGGTSNTRTSRAWARFPCSPIPTAA